MIETNARRLPASRVTPFQPLALDFAKLVAERRADRVGAHVRREATNKHADDIQQRVNAENLRNERERLGKLLQVGAVPAHILAPIIQRALGEEVAAMDANDMDVDYTDSETESDVDSDLDEDLRNRTTLLRYNHIKDHYQTSTRTQDHTYGSGGPVCGQH